MQMKDTFVALGRRVATRAVVGGAVLLTAMLLLGGMQYLEEKKGKLQQSPAGDVLKAAPEE